MEPEDFLTYVLGEEEGQFDQYGVTEEFENAGFVYIEALANMGMTTIYILVIPLFFLASLACVKVNESNIKSWQGRLFAYLRSSFAIRLIIELTLPLSIMASIDFKFNL